MWLSFLFKEMYIMYVFTFSGFLVGSCISEEEGYLLPIWCWKITCWCFDWMLKSSSAWKHSAKHRQVIFRAQVGNRYPSSSFTRFLFATDNTYSSCMWHWHPQSLRNNNSLNYKWEFYFHECIHLIMPPTLLLSLTSIGNRKITFIPGSTVCKYWNTEEPGDKAYSSCIWHWHPQPIVALITSGSSIFMDAYI